MPLIYELDLAIVMTYLPAKMNFLCQSIQKLESEKTDKQTDQDKNRQIWKYDLSI